MCTLLNPDICTVWGYILGGWCEGSEHTPAVPGAWLLGVKPIYTEQLVTLCGPVVMKGASASPYLCFPQGLLLCRDHDPEPLPQLQFSCAAVMSVSIHALYLPMHRSALRHVDFSPQMLWPGSCPQELPCPCSAHLLEAPALLTQASSAAPSPPGAASLHYPLTVLKHSTMILT